MTRTSSISGTFVNRQRSPVSVAAASILRAAFFEPLIGTSPRSGTPPSIRKTSGVICSGTYSQWNGRASAKGHHHADSHRRRARQTCRRRPSCWRRSATRIRMSAVWSAARARGVGGGGGGGEVGALDVAGFERLLGLPARVLGAGEIDVRRHVGGLG